MNRRPKGDDCHMCGVPIEVTSGQHSGRTGKIIEDRHAGSGHGRQYHVQLLGGGEWLRESEVRKIDPAEMERRQAEERAQAEQQLRGAIPSADATRLRKAIGAAEVLRVDATALLRQAHEALRETLGLDVAVAAYQAHIRPASAPQPGSALPALAQQHAFCDAAKSRDFAKVKAMLDREPALVNVQPAQRWSALHQFSKAGNEEAVELLLALHADKAAKTKDGETPLDVAHHSVRRLLTLGSSAADPLLELLNNRPVRTGKWFTIFESLKPEIEHEEVCDIHAEFLQHHPNGGDKTTAGFISIRLTDEQIKRYEHLIRISSYRWEDLKGLGAEGKEKMIPANYIHFLKRIRERGQILWMDWMSHDGVNAPPLETLKYMGSLYSQNTVLGDWMLEDDRLKMALLRAWIFQEMSFGRLDREAMAGLFEQLRGLGRAMSHQLKVEAAVKAYVLACGCVASLLTRRAFGAVAARCGWFKAIEKYPEANLGALGVNMLQAQAVVVEAKAELPGVDEHTWGRLLLLCSTQKNERKGFDWTEPWEAHCQELLELVCAAPYTSCRSLDELVQRYARGLLGAALGCEVSFESDRPEAITAVVRSIARTEYRVELSAAKLMKLVWQSVIAEMAANSYNALASFGSPKVHAPIMIGSSSFALEPLQLHGTLVTYEQKKNERGNWSLTCHYITADGSVATFEDHGVVASAVCEAGLKLRAPADRNKGVPEKPLPKPQDATGAEADICLCVPGAEPFATAAKGFAFLLFTQHREDLVDIRTGPPKESVLMKGNRVISLQVVSKEGTRDEDDDEDYSPDVEAKPPRPDIGF